MNKTKHSASPRMDTRRRNNQKNGRRPMRLLTSVLLLLCILFAFCFLFLRSSFGKIENYELDLSEIAVNEQDANLDDYQTIALFGVDNQDNKIKDIGSRTDSIILACIHNSSKKVKLMSIYRDTYVSIDGKYDKINAAYAYGGPEQAINTINRNLDLNITDFATVNFKALADAVDILGGVELTVKSEKELENLNAYIKNMNKINGGDSPVFDDTGTHHFDGNQAVAYSRIRYMEGGDHERANHQRLVLQAIMNQAKKRPWKLKKLIDKVLPQCKTSLSTGDLTRLSLSLPRYSIEDSQAYPFDSVDTKYGGIYYGFPLTAASNAIEAHAYLFGTKDYEPTEELTKISAKIEAITDDFGY
ncbi:MAG: LCP family protein [Eubacteriales bacterium]|nr:LCP family protein [Eubacteriales bacterium]